MTYLLHPAPHPSVKIRTIIILQTVWLRDKFNHVHCFLKVAVIEKLAVRDRHSEHKG